MGETINHRGKLAAICTAIGGTVVLTITIVLARGWLWERWCLYELGHGKDLSNWALIVDLYERKCAAVTPYLLVHYRMDGTRRTVGTLGMQSWNPQWWDRIQTLVGLAPECVPYLAEDLSRPAPDHHLLVLDVLQELGTGAIGALPQLVDFLKQVALNEDQDIVVEEGLKSLLAIGEPATTAFCGVTAHILQEACNRKDEYVILRVLDSIRQLPKGRATPLLKPLLDLDLWIKGGQEHSDMEELQMMLLLTFGVLGPIAIEATPTLEEALKSEELRPWAALSLSCIIPAHREATDVLIEKLSNPEAEGWLPFVARMRPLTPPLPILFPHLERGLEATRDAEAARIIAVVMCAIDRDATRRRLFALLENDVPERRLLALKCLLEIFNRPEELFQKLRLLSLDPNSEIASAAAAALARAGDLSEEALRIYTIRLRGDIQDGEYEFAEALGTLARSRAEARRVVVSALAPGSGSERLALEAAEWLYGTETEVLLAIERLCESEDSRLKTRATEVLKSLRKLTVSATPSKSWPAR